MKVRTSEVGLEEFDAVLFLAVIFDLVLVLVFWTKCSLVLVTF